MEQDDKNFFKKIRTKVYGTANNDIIVTDEDGEYRYDPDTDNYEYYPDWLGNVQNEREFWETV